MHFPGLHGLRFFAALVVVIGHVELLAKYNGYPNAADQPAVYELGRIAVTFFFVLSGFLITYLLLAERSRGGIAIGKFYVRRVLRIWPLYYLTVALAFFIVPRIGAMNVPELSAALHVNFGAKLALFLAFLPQVALSLFAPVPYGEPLWSIGVEEQFYLVWPLVVARFRRLIPVLFTIIIGGIVVKEAALAYASRLRDPSRLPFWNHFIDYFYFNRFECMAIGGLAAWILFERKKRLLDFVFSMPVQLLALALAAYALITSRGKPLLHYAPVSVVFAIVILNVAANRDSLLKLRHPIFTFLGNISYAMYLLHEIVIGAVMRVQVALTGTHYDTVGAKAVLHLASAGLTIALSAIVYRYFELSFLRLKRRFAVVESGPVPATSVPAVRPAEVPV